MIEPRVKKTRKRDAEATKGRILQTAKEAFAANGYSGARIDQISDAAGVNMQLIYRYFGNKEALYIAVLEETYRDVRTQEAKLDVNNLTPIEGIKKLTAFTFDYLSSDPYFVRIMMNENLLEAKFARMSDRIPETTRPLILSLETLLARGQRDGSLREVSAIELYIVILSLSFVHVSNRFTLEQMMGSQVSDPEQVAARRSMMIEVVTRFIAAESD